MNAKARMPKRNALGRGQWGRGVTGRCVGRGGTGVPRAEGRRGGPADKRGRDQGSVGWPAGVMPRSRRNGSLALLTALTSRTQRARAPADVVQRYSTVKYTVAQKVK